RGRTRGRPTGRRTPTTGRTGLRRAATRPASVGACVAHSGRAIGLSRFGDFKTASRPSGPLATLAHRHAHRLCDEALHGETDARMLSGQRRERTPKAADHVATVALDMRPGAQLLVQHLADHRHARRASARHSWPLTPPGPEPSAGLSE